MFNRLLRLRRPLRPLSAIPALLLLTAGLVLLPAAAQAVTSPAPAPELATPHAADTPLAASMSDEDLSRGYAGIPWGSPESQPRDLEPLGSQGDFSYYAPADTPDTFWNLPVDEVVLAFYRQGFCCVMVVVDGHENYEPARQAMEQRLGPPDQSGREGLTWRRGKLEYFLEFDEDEQASFIHITALPKGQ